MEKLNKPKITITKIRKQEGVVMPEAELAQVAGGLNPAITEELTSSFGPQLEDDLDGSLYRHSTNNHT